MSKNNLNPGQKTGPAITLATAASQTLNPGTKNRDKLIIPQNQKFQATVSVATGRFLGRPGAFVKRKNSKNQRIFVFLKRAPGFGLARPMIIRTVSQ